MNLISHWSQQFEEKKLVLEEKSKIVEKTLFEMFKDEKVIITSRVKEVDSLHEKIIRNNYVLKYKQEDYIFDFLKDGIGVRIICLEQNDEEIIYKKLKEKFKDTNICNNLTFTNSILEQPEFQKNGHPIYRINGTIETFTFELQIKSLSHMLWGEIEHLLVYKNYNCNIGSKFLESQIEQVYNDLVSINERISNLKKYVIKDTLGKELDEIKEISKSLLQKRSDPYIKVLYNGINLDFRSMYEAIIIQYYRDFNYVYLGKQKKKTYDNIYNMFQKLVVSVNGINDEIIKNIATIDIGQDYVEETEEYKILKVLEKLLINDEWALFFNILVYLKEENLSDFIAKFVSELKIAYALEFSFIEDDEEELIAKDDIKDLKCAVFDKYLELLIKNEDFHYIEENFIFNMKECITICFDYLVHSQFFTLDNDMQNEVMDIVFLLSEEWASFRILSISKFNEFLKCMDAFDDEFNIFTRKSNNINLEELRDILGRLKNND